MANNILSNAASAEGRFRRQQAPMQSGAPQPSVSLREQAPSFHMNAMRGLAALAVLFSHLRALFFVDYEQVAHKGSVVRLLYLFTGLGHEAVVVFFVLSGYLVAGSVLKAEARGRWSVSQYALNRLTRLYVVLLPALLLGACWDNLGMHLFGLHGVYGGTREYRLIIPVSVAQTATSAIWLGNLAFLQGIFVRPFGSNGPLWSLSYEFWYYLLFPCFWLAWLPSRSKRVRAAYFVVGVLAACLVGKLILCYFSIWLLGAALNLVPRLRHSLGTFAAVASLLLLAGAMLVSRLRLLPPGFAIDFLLGVIFTLVLYVVLNLRAHSVPVWYGHASSTLSGVSYTLYLVHFPMLVLLNGWLLQIGPRWQPAPSYGIQTALVLAVVMLYTGVVWRLTEANTDTIRKRLQARFVPGASRT